MPEANEESQMNEEIDEDGVPVQRRLEGDFISRVVLLLDFNQIVFNYIFRVWGPEHNDCR